MITNSFEFELDGNARQDRYRNQVDVESPVIGMRNGMGECFLHGVSFFLYRF